MNTYLEIVLKLTALVHLGLITAGLLMPRATDLWKDCAKLTPFARTLFRVYYAFIGLNVFMASLCMRRV